ncbi:ribbon-helix-helix domain-containing protein [Methanofollis sp. W23]|uniref:ribbon-helix-helix domain-containing protein n=1 Tax=Methanofollis sp. W23 TaxID=2817849 RepID=UPI001AE44DEB|nr:ribbon-helix-helix domain-containing protein [Methanofollis sp. W23]
MERITIRLPKQQVEMLQRLVDNGEFPTVSEAVRHAVRDLVEKRGDRAVRESDQVSVKV